MDWNEAGQCSPLSSSLIGRRDYSIYLHRSRCCFIRRSKPQEVPNNLDDANCYGKWEVNGRIIPVVSTFRLAWRVTGFRTIYPSLIPQGARHPDMVYSAGPMDSNRALLAGVVAASLVGDFFVRSSNVSHIRKPSIEGLPLINPSALQETAIRLFLRLNCLSEAYADLWESMTGENWTTNTPIRNSLERERAMVSLDVIVGIALGLTAEELCVIYRNQFPAMRKYDLERLFDKNGRQVPKEMASNIESDSRLGLVQKQSESWTHPNSLISYTFKPPFQPFDRESEIKNQFQYYVALCD